MTVGPARLITALVLVAVACGPPAPRDLDPVTCDQPSLTVGNRSGARLDVYARSATTNRDELIGTVEPRSTTTLPMPPGATGDIRVAGSAPGANYLNSDVQWRIHCA